MGRLDCDSSEMEEEELLVHSVLTLVVQSWLIMWMNLKYSQFLGVVPEARQRTKLRYLDVQDM